MTLRVTTLTVGPLESNCHLCWNADTGKGVVVDPGADAAAILRSIEQNGFTVEAIWLTHAHGDHIGAAAAVKRATNAPVTIHPAEEAWLSDDNLNLAALLDMSIEPVEADHHWENDQQFDALGTTWKVMHVPGHSPGGVAIYSEDEGLAFSGDLLFRGSMGRVYLPNGNPIAMATSLVKFFRLPDDLRLFVGHGPDTTLAVEKSANMVVEDFLART